MMTTSLEATGAPDLDIAAVAVSTKHLIFQKCNGALWPLRVDRSPVDAALPVFGPPEAARQYLLARRLGSGWQVRMCGNGELVSILSRLCRSVETIVLDPHPDSVLGRDASEMSRERFLDVLLKNRGALESASVPV